MGVFESDCRHCGSTEHASENCPHGIFSSKCRHCGSVGHSSDDCPHDIFSNKCRHCGSVDHSSDDCPHDIFSSKCRHCGSINHSSDDCPHGIFASKCRHCRSVDHASDNCPQGLLASPRPNRISAVSDDDDAVGGCLGKLVIGGLAVGVAIWLISVAILLLIINVSVVALAAAYFYPRFRTWLIPISAVGTISSIAIHNSAWSDRIFRNDLSIISEFQNPMFYIGVFSGLVAFYFVINSILNRVSLQEPNPNYLSSREKIIVLCLVASGIVVVGVQRYLDAHNSNANAVFEGNATPAEVSSDITGVEVRMYAVADANARDRPTAIGSQVVYRLMRGVGVDGVMQVGEDGASRWFNLAHGKAFISSVNLSEAEPPILSKTLGDLDWRAPVELAMHELPDNNSMVVETESPGTHLIVVGITQNNFAEIKLNKGGVGYIPSTLLPESASLNEPRKQ